MDHPVPLSVDAIAATAHSLQEAINAVLRNPHQPAKQPTWVAKGQHATLSFGYSAEHNQNMPSANFATDLAQRTAERVDAMPIVPGVIMLIADPVSLLVRHQDKEFRRFFAPISVEEYAHGAVGFTQNMHPSYLESLIGATIPVRLRA